MFPQSFLFNFYIAFDTFLRGGLQCSNMCTRNISEVLFQRNLLFSKFKISTQHPAASRWQQHSKKLYDHFRVGAIVQFS